MIWLWFSLRARSLFFFSAANPAIETGGLLGESKKDILCQVPAEWKPLTLFFTKDQSFPQLIEGIKAKSLSFPLIAKPNVGERGLLVEKIPDIKALEAYWERHKVDLLIQEYIGHPVELSVLYYRFPGENKGTISSVCIKEYLTVTGDGISSLGELIQAYPRARFQLATLRSRYETQWEDIPNRDQTIELIPIGNHARGATFWDANHLIDEELIHWFDQVHSQLKDIYFCRFDLKCQSVEGLREGKNFKILEINGVGAEPAHIYDPANSLLRAYRDMYRHWQAIFRVSRKQRALGIPYMKFGEAWRFFTHHMEYKRQAVG